MKKFAAIILVLALAVSICGCEVELREFERVKKRRNAPTTATTEATVPETQAAQEPQPIMNTMYGYWGQQSAGWLTLYDNNTFFMVVNLFEGWGSIAGTYYGDLDGLIYCTITSKNFSGAWGGSEVQGFTLEWKGNNAYMITFTNVEWVGMVSSGTYFYIS